MDRRMTPRTDKELIEEGNELARRFYQCQGYDVPRGYRFDKATHPAERVCWQMAALAYDHIEQTDLDNAVASEEDV